MIAKSRINCMLILLVLFSLAGCAEYFGSRQSRYTSSVVDYLYPKKEIAATPSIPHLSLPLNVGIAFVPESGAAAAYRLNRKEKTELLKRISSEFRTLPFVRNIEMIPTDYLTPSGGFQNLDQIRTMYGIDVIALISYDQVQHTDEGLLSISYWTIIGAYAVRGEKNDTSTLVDAVLVDIASRKMLFRAPGTSHIRATSTWVNLSEQLRNDSLKGFESAADNLVKNLRAELDRFKQKVKETPESCAIEHKPGYSSTGGGSLGAGYALTLLFLGGCALWSGGKR
jgi:rhombotail lipoprotein